MNRTHLTEAVGSIVTARGYVFHTSTEEYLPTAVAELPAAFMPYPEFRGVEGRRRGKITWSLTLHLLAAGSKLSPKQRAAELGRLEEEALAILQELSDAAEVLAIEEVQMTPSAMRLTTRGDVSLTVTADAICLFEDKS